MTFAEELENLFIKYTDDTLSLTPDYILAKYMEQVWLSVTKALQQKDVLYKKKDGK